MDERHGMDHLDRAGGGDGGGLVAADELAGGDAENRADPLAAGEEGVSHGFVDLLRVAQRNGCVQGFVDCVGLVEHVDFEIEGLIFDFRDSHSTGVYLSGHSRD